MKKKQFHIVFALSLLTGLLLVACGAQSAPEQTETQMPQVADPAETATEVPTESPPSVTPTEPPTEASGAAVSFADDVLPIIESRCINCHGGRTTEGGLLMRTYDEIMAGSENGPILIAGDPENSPMVELISAGKMPKKGPKLTPPQFQIIMDWIAQGALNN